MTKLTPSAAFLGEFYYERVGYYMENAGDVNGDGCEDFLIGTFHNRENGYDAGAAYLILGNRNNIWGMKQRLRTADARFLGKHEYDAFGYYVSGNGDANGDGYDDFLIGAPAGNELGGPNPGYAFLFLGKATADWGFDCVARDAADAYWMGSHAYDHVGQAVAMLGDINGDGFDDFLIGAPLNDDGSEESGKAYLFLGKASGWRRGADIEAAANASFICQYYKAWAGYTVSSAGDMNGDGMADFLIGAPFLDRWGGRVYLFFGRKKADWGANFDIDHADVIFQGENYGDKAGWSVASAGDVNGDGLSDILIGAYGNDHQAAQAGKVYLILGRKSNWQRIVQLNEAEASWYGERIDDQAGWSAASVPDLNYDGCDEILIGAWHNDQIGDNCGKAYLIYGKPSGWQTDQSLAGVTDYFVGEYDGDYAGYCVTGNDANGDGLGDIWISAAYNSDSQEHAGKVYLFLSERDRYDISGQIRYYSNGEPVPGVQINILGGTRSWLVSDTNGLFSQILPHHIDYYFVPCKASYSDLNSETIIAYDAALTLQVAVEKLPLDSLQWLAANADQDSFITAYDAALIARYVVGYRDSNSAVGKWVFSPTQRTIHDLAQEHHRLDFSAIVVGNVHGGWQPFMGDSLPRTLASLPLPQAQRQGKRVIIPFEIEQPMELSSLEIQLALPSDRFSVVDVQLGSMLSRFQWICNQQKSQIKLVLYSAHQTTAIGELVSLVLEPDNDSPDFDHVELIKYQINDFPSVRGMIELRSPIEPMSPKNFALHQNYPNPFNSETAIRLSVSRNCKIHLAIYNLRGDLVRLLEDKSLAPGNYQFVWNGRDQNQIPLASGVYLCRAIAGQELQTVKLIMIK
ncbi:MAG: FG-GAP-like repeat-containing protein [candidate division KSB1 bacterium]|nr:FG-GAP-like repeat-containing protein [candidate division KSB1 bacterium]